MSTDDRISIEDRVRIATRARASMVTDLRPLPAPGSSPLRHRSVLRSPRSRRWLTWGVPLAAAVAVVAIALSLVAIRHDNTLPVRPQPPVNATQGIPRYFVTMKTASQDGAGTLIVGDDQAGTVIATVTAPPGVQFYTVTGADDDRSFLVTGLSRKPSGHTYTYYLLRLDPGTARPYQLTRLPIAHVAGSSGPPALSPDGTELAVESFQSENDTRLTVFSVASGAALRTWTLKTRILDGPVTGGVSWLPDGKHIVFDIWKATRIELHALDVTAPGTDLLTASRIMLTIPLSGTCSLGPKVTGGTVVCFSPYAYLPAGAAGSTASPGGCLPNGLRFVVHSVRTGKPVQVVYRFAGACAADPALGGVVWVDASGSHVIGGLMFPGSSGAPAVNRLGVITQAGGFKPLKLPEAVTPQEYTFMAF